MIVSPPVQPSVSSTSGTGSVQTMWLEDTVSRSRSGGSVPDDAQIAITAWRPRARPAAVRSSIPSGTGRAPRTRLPS